MCVLRAVLTQAAHTGTAPQVIGLLDYYAQPSSLVLVFEYMKTDLANVLRRESKPMCEASVKMYMQMLLKGVAYVHKNSLIHRVGGASCAPASAP